VFNEDMFFDEINGIHGFSGYLPMLDVEQFWLRTKDYVPLEDITNDKPVNITMQFYPYWYFYFILEQQMKVNFQSYSDYGIMDNSDELKEMILDTNRLLFILGIIVSLLHTIFEFLALKNGIFDLSLVIHLDVMFWKNVKSHKGLSLKTLYMNLFFEIVILLYLLDNETSKMIIFGCFTTIGVTIWKLFSTSNISRRVDGKFPYI